MKLGWTVIFKGVKTNHFNKGKKGEMLTMGWRGCELYFGVKNPILLGWGK